MVNADPLVRGYRSCGCPRRQAIANFNVAILADQVPALHWQHVLKKIKTVLERGCLLDGYPGLLLLQLVQFLGQEAHRLFEPPPAPEWIA